MAASALQMLKGSAPYAMGDFIVTSLGKTSYYLDGPENGPLILTIHGLNASSSQYASFAQIMTGKGYRILRFDLLGHGMSDELPLSAPEGYTLLLYNQIIEVMTLLAVVDVEHDVVGFSLGGYLAVEYVTRRRHLVGKLVLISCAGLIPAPPPRKLKLVSSRWLKWLSLPLLNSIFKLCCWLVEDELMEKYYTQWPPLDRPLDCDMTNWRRIAFRNMQTALALTASMELWANEDLFRKLAEGNDDLQVMFAWGQNDAITPYGETEAFLCTLFPGARWCVYPLCHHMLLDEATPAIMVDIFNFIAGKGLGRTPTASPKTAATFGLMPHQNELSIHMPTASPETPTAPDQPSLNLVQCVSIQRRPSSGLRAQTTGYRLGTGTERMQREPDLVERAQSELSSVYSIVKTIEQRQGVKWAGSVHTPGAERQRVRRLSTISATESGSVSSSRRGSQCDLFLELLFRQGSMRKGRSGADSESTTIASSGIEFV